MLTVELPGLAAVRIDAATRMIAVDGISGGAEAPFGADWALGDLRSGIYGDFHRLLPADQCLDAACAASGQQPGKRRQLVHPGHPAARWHLRDRARRGCQRYGSGRGTGH